jgi:hypothetical protein
MKFWIPWLFLLSTFGFALLGQSDTLSISSISMDTNMGRLFLILALAAWILVKIYVIGPPSLLRNLVIVGWLVFAALLTGTVLTVRPYFSVLPRPTWTSYFESENAWQLVLRPLIDGKLDGEYVAALDDVKPGMILNHEHWKFGIRIDAFYQKASFGSSSSRQIRSDGSQVSGITGSLGRTAKEGIRMYGDSREGRYPGLTLSILDPALPKYENRLILGIEAIANSQLLTWRGHTWMVELRRARTRLPFTWKWADGTLCVADLKGMRTRYLPMNPGNRSRVHHGYIWHLGLADTGFMQGNPVVITRDATLYYTTISWGILILILTGAAMIPIRNSNREGSS